MTDPTRETRLTRAFVTLADTLISDFDVIDLLQILVDTCVEVLDVQAAGLLLKNTSGTLQLVASTTEDAEFVELVQLAAESGPCLECVATGNAITVPDIAETETRWPEFRDAALAHGFQSLQATPLRLRDDIIGTMNLLDTSVGALNPIDIAAAQALCDVATIGILAERAVRERDVVSTQLQVALDSRVVIEQAKGLLSQSLDLSMGDAFALIRAYARSHNLALRVVATALIERRLDTTRVAEDFVTRRSNDGRG